MRKIALWICCVMALQAGVYEGKIGKYPITMLLGDNSDDMNMYRYKGKLLSIPLKGKRVTKLCEPDPKADKEDDAFVAGACFEGKLSGVAYSIYSGTWHKIGSKRKLPFHLKMLELPKKTNSYGDTYTDEEFYYDLLKEVMTFKPSKKRGSTKGLEYRFVVEPVTKIAQKRIILPHKKVENRINKKLEQIHKEHVMQQIYCLDDRNVDEVYDEYSINVEYYHQPFLLLSESGSSYCGGAHPNNSYEQYLFDLKSGEEIYYTGLFNLYEKDKEGQEAVKPSFQTLINRYLTETESIDTCYRKEEDQQRFILSPAESERVAVRLTGMGHAGFACELEPIALIPVGKMKPFTQEEARKYYPSLKQNNAITKR